MTLNVILNDKINGIGFDVTDQRFSGSGLWSLNRTEWTEFVWTWNGPGPELDNRSFINHTAYFFFEENAG